MKKTVNIIAWFLALTVGVQAAYYVCVGLNTVTNYTALEYAESDAAQMAKALAAQGHTTKLLVGADATREKILEAVKEEGATFFFAGHAEDDYLLTVDGKLTLTEIAQRVSTLMLDSCNVGKSIRETGKTRILAAAQHEAFEGEGHGLFAKYLLDWVKTGKSFTDSALEKHIRQNIMEETGGWQRPVFGFI
jgi:hypothetical protein